MEFNIQVEFLQSLLLLIEGKKIVVGGFSLDLSDAYSIVFESTVLYNYFLSLSHSREVYKIENMVNILAKDIQNGASSKKWLEKKN